MESMKPDFHKVAESIFNKLIIRKYSPNDIEVLASELEEIYDQGAVYGVLRATETMDMQSDNEIQIERRASPRITPKNIKFDLIKKDN